MTCEFDNRNDRVAPANDLFLPFLRMVLQKSAELDALRDGATGGRVQAEPGGQNRSLTGAGG